jgi:nucleoid-associated protein YgaU
VEAQPVSTVAPAGRSVVLSHVTTVVEPGDSLWSIAERALGDPFRWRSIWRLNRGRLMGPGERFVDPSLIKPRWRLRLR